MAVEMLRAWVSNSAFRVTMVYSRRSNGDLQFDGVRPEGGWHAHGYFAVLLWMVEQGQPRRMRVWKRRWLLVAEGRTVHSRPPDQLPYIRSCTLVIVLLLWSWLDSDRGVQTHRQVIPALEGLVSPRTAQRWLRRGLPHAMTIQQRIREAVIERSEPRPVEHLFPCGLSPPEGLRRRRWRDPAEVWKLWRGLALLMIATTGLNTPVAVLLAEARGR